MNKEIIAIHDAKPIIYVKLDGKLKALHLNHPVDDIQDMFYGLPKWRDIDQVEVY